MSGPRVGSVNQKKAQEAQTEAESGDRRYWKVPEGTSRIRIMPPPEGYEEYFKKIGFHYDVGPDGRVFPCPRVGKARKTCVLCEEADQLMKSSDEDDQADGKALRPTSRYLITVMDCKNLEKGFQVWACGVKAFREVNYYFAEPEWGDVSDLYEGYDFTVIRKGTGKNNTEYQVKIARKSSDFIETLQAELEEYSDEMFDELPLLDEFLSYATDEEMEAALNGEESESKGKGDRKRSSKDEDEDERPARRRASKDDDEDEKPARRARRADSPSFPDEDEEKPARRSRSEPVADDDGDEDPDAEPEEAEAEPEEKPARARTSGRTPAGDTASRARRALRD